MSETVVSELATSPLSQKKGSREPSIVRASDNDSRSSSLSELEFGTEERDGTPNRVYNETESDGNDSEAETEKLENTPRKLAKAGMLGALNDIDRYHSPSKLSSHVPMETSSPNRGSPTLGTSRAATNSTTINGNGSTRETSQPPSTASDDSKGDLGMKRKRKRSVESSSHTDTNVTQEEEPTKKRNVSTRAKGLDIASQAEDEAQGNKSVAGNSISENLEQAQFNLAEEAIKNEGVDEYSTLKPTRTKKGKRKGKSRPGESAREVDEEAPINSDTLDEPVFDSALVDREDGEIAINNEEAQRKDAALSSLGAVEAQFAEFRSKLFGDRIAQFSHELQLLRQPNCTHPEYLAQLRCVDERRKERINYENTLLRYKQRALGVRLRAEHSQLHSQYFQDVREIRDKALERCGKFLYDIQKGRRRWGANDSDYTCMYQPKRSRQLQQQAAYNLEVAILSGVAKYVGFPAAPEMKGASSFEAEEDFRSMRMTSYPTMPISYTNSETTRTAQASAEERFLEQTPWANPQHPAHSRVHVRSSTQTPRFPSNSFMTPAAQQRKLDAMGPVNGSASTVEMPSNAPSSAAAASALPASASIDHMRLRKTNKSPITQASNGTLKTPGNRYSETADQNLSTPQLHDPIEIRKALSKTGSLQGSVEIGSRIDASAAIQPTLDDVKRPPDAPSEPFSSPQDSRHNIPMKRDGAGEGEVPSPSIRMSAGLTGMVVGAKVR